MKLMSVLAIIFGVYANATPAKIEAGKYAIDPAHTKIGFEISHLVISTVDGRFDQYTGDVEMGKTVDDTKLNATLQVASINTGNGDRDKHLKGPDFFNAEQFPTITFKSTKITGKADALKITGDLTLHGVTKSVTLDGKYMGVVNDPFGNTKVAFVARGKLSRKDFGLTWSKTIEAGPVVGDEVVLSLNVEAGKPIAKTAGK